MMVQGIVKKGGIFVVDAASVPSEDLAKGAAKVKVRYLVDERHGSDRFALRLYTVEKGGRTPLDEHQYEHQVYVLSGRGLLSESKEIGEPKRPLRPGEAIFIPSNAVHQFFNEEEAPFIFLCVKGNPNLYMSREGTAPSESGRNFC